MKNISLFILIFSTISSPLFSQNTTVFSDDFETPQTWTIFEEIVSGNACYGDNIGEVMRSTDLAQNGTNALRVWSNKNVSTKSNHVIAAHHISNTDGITGQLRYGMWAYMATNIGLTQSGPEFSVQSTRTVGAQNLTYIAGIQYIGNQWVADKWNIWHNGTWQTIKLSEFGTTLAVNTWYYLELTFNMTTNTYTEFKIQGGSLNVSLNLTHSFQNAPSGFQIGGEARGWTPSLFVTAESENLWTTCSEIRENKVYYDDVLLESVVVLPIDLTHFEGHNTEGGNFLTWQFADTKDLDRVEVQKSKDGERFITFNPQTLKGGEAMDRTPFDVTYYRLKMNELDGKTTFSKTIAVKRSDTEGGIKVHPNPVTHFLTVQTDTKGDIAVLNFLGQCVLKGHTTLPLDVSALPKGCYILKMGGQQTKFIKQ